MRYLERSFQLELGWTGQQGTFRSSPLSQALQFLTTCSKAPFCCSQPSSSLILVTPQTEAILLFYHLCGRWEGYNGKHLGQSN